MQAEIAAPGCGLHMSHMLTCSWSCTSLVMFMFNVKPAQWSQPASESFPVTSRMASDLGKDAACCSKGDSWDGEPSGRIVKIGDLDTYLATPVTPQPSSRAVLLVSGVLSGLACHYNCCCSDKASMWLQLHTHVACTRLFSAHGFIASSVTQTSTAGT